MNIFSQIFSTCFLFLGALIWVLALLIVLIGTVGILRVVTKEVFEVDLIKNFRGGKNESGRCDHEDRG